MRTLHSSVSATIRSFSSVDQRRRRSLPVMISIAPDNIKRNLDLKHRLKVITKPASPRCAHRSLTMGVAPHKPDHRCSIVLSTQPLEKTAKQFNWFSDPCRKFV